MIQFLYATAFSPFASPCIKAIRREFFQSYPGLTAALFQKYLPPSIASSKGHLDQTRKDFRSTTTLPPLDPDPPQETNNEQTHCLFATIKHTRKMYTDQTVRFPVNSSHGSQYVLLLYNYDSKAILTEPLKNCKGTEIIQGYAKLHTYLFHKGLRPHTHWLDNEASTDLKKSTLTTT